MNIKMFLNFKEYNKEGVLIREKEHLANSLLKPFLAPIICQFRGTAEVNIVDTTNTARSVASGASYYYSNPSIIVGTGTNAVSFSDYNLQTGIANGTAAGQLVYGPMIVDGALTVSGSDCYFLTARSFTNSSGSDITIHEVGLTSRIANSSTQYFLIDRTLSAYTIANGNSVIITYKIMISV